ncbi:HNH endonuclease [Vibrio parahaemolyticus]|uniref:HNH endonuclease n=2 Tax=Vibrio parahaemolyticus TaxID=670 RepID=UPI0006A5FC13|nr:HNH endonuclease [Vibrio parahaemolyticus]EGQ8928201.1 HNH endonuclease [Vibrio parahaemolyticus]EGQ8972843.1 HNH endonuclease [Vibrio parahaemolyticus]EGQ8977293.1 HNH endonuclease [Vibrio parahaemolyticus]EGQ8996846.1 HNH endonuclease [Vibrio parahaemolyticus]EGQ9001730.1 HNH endonuclease [Vibrio parahaemolyticus]
MRQIDRNSVAVPANLLALYRNQQLYQSELDNISQGRNSAKGTIYGHDDVKNALNALYKNVCFICQKSLATGYEIEHFLPWSTHFPARAYDWNNLHKSCDKCNSMKRKVKYKQRCTTDNKKVLDMLILSPTSTSQIEQLIDFDPHSFEAIDNSNNNTKVAKTVEFLNDTQFILDRNRHWNALTDFLMSEPWSETLRNIKHRYLNFSNITLDIVNNNTESLIGEFCYRIHKGYLSVNSPYNRFSNAVIPNRIRLPIALLKEYSSQYCSSTNQTLPW